MAELIAVGVNGDQYWRRVMPVGLPLVIGRRHGTLSVPKDPTIHGAHVQIQWNGHVLRVCKVAPEKKPIQFRGRPVSEATLRLGEKFALGQTTFSLVEEEATLGQDLKRPDDEQFYDTADLSRPFRDANHRIDLLSRLPQVLARASSRSESSRLAALLAEGLPHADTVIFVKTDSDAEPDSPIEELHRWQHKMYRGQPIAFSRQLVRNAIRRRQSIVHKWYERPDPTRPQYTIAEETDWAFCTPLRGESINGQAIYVAGHHSSGSGHQHTPDADWDPREDVKFTEIVASYLSALGQADRLSRQRAALGRFFSPVVLERLAEESADDVLAPRRADVSVLFCDLRGFSKASEEGADDLMGLLERVGAALGVSTEQILGHGGVIGDFQGDSVMGFWGWPDPLSPDEAAALACRAALSLRERMEAASRGIDTPLGNFRMGIGIASGNAVAGRIGSPDQGKVSVFGPVVNLASRLEGMTKLLGAPILIDTPTACAARARFGPDQARFRTVARVRPKGMTSDLELTEILPPSGEEAGPSDDDLDRYEEALQEFIEGRWLQALTILGTIRPPDPRSLDPVTKFLMEHIKKERVTPPEGWNGIIHLEKKRVDE
ncbi:adenylate/guanylate cyclase domain-containing protein [soil metagenome]